MFRWLPFVLILLGLGYVLSVCNVHVFTWRDTNELERIVVAPKAPTQSTNVPQIPDELKNDNRLTYKKGAVGLGSYTVKTVQKMMPKGEEKDAEGNVAVETKVPPRMHSVGHPDWDRARLEAPSLEDAPPAQLRPSAIEIGKNVPAPSTQEIIHQATTEVQRKSVRRYETREDIIVFSFFVDPWDIDDMKNKQQFDEFLSIVAQGDLVALQGIRGANLPMLKMFAEHLTQYSGREYRFAADLNALSRNPNEPASIFLYDATTMEADPNSVFQVCAAGKPFAFPPLAAKFRTKKAPANEAFTFYATSVYLNPTFESAEAQYLPNVVEIIRQRDASMGGVPEDDILFLGHFRMNPEDIHIGSVDYQNSLTWAVRGIATNTWGKYRLTSENIMLLRAETSEFTGDGGIWNLRTQLNRKKGIPFDMHPVWATFSVYEGGRK